MILLETGYEELPKLCGKEDEKAESNTLQTDSGMLLTTKNKKQQRSIC
jgi:hypothetical protein